MESFKVSHKGETIKVPLTVRASWLENRFVLPEGSVLGVQLPNGLEVDLTSDSKCAERLQLRDHESILLITKISSNTQQPTPLIDWSASEKLPLFGGTGGQTGQTTYLAPNGTVVQASSPVRNNSNSYYYMSYLFNNNPDSTSDDSYWLPDPTGSNQTLGFTFRTPVNLERIKVCATTYSSNTSPGLKWRSDYSITATTSSGEAVKVTSGFIDTSLDPLGYFHEHIVRKVGIVSVLFTLTHAKAHVTLKEIEFYVCL